MPIPRLALGLLAGLLFVLLSPSPAAAQADAVPDGYRNVWLRDLATQIRNELRLLDGAVDQYVIEHNLPPKTTVRFEQLKAYLKAGTRLHDRGVDPLGTPYAKSYVAGELPRVPAASALALAEAVDYAFWGPYEVESTTGVRPAALPPMPTPPPGFDAVRARKRDQGTAMKNELRLIDAAKDQYSIEFNKTDMTPAWSDLTRYFKPGSRLATSPKPVDLFGNPYVLGDLATPPKISPATVRALADACDDAFWSPFQ